MHRFYKFKDTHNVYAQGMMIKCFLLNITFFVALSMVTPVLFAQQPIIDVYKHTVDRNTEKFSDGKTTLTAYVNATLAQKTKCCGEDHIFLEVKVDDKGKVTDVRPVGGKSECFKKSVADIVKHLTFSVDPAVDKKRTFFPKIKVNVSCKGGEDNKYVEVKAPEPIKESGLSVPKDDAKKEDKKKPEPPSPAQPSKPESSTPPPSAPSEQPARAETNAPEGSPAASPMPDSATVALKRKPAVLSDPKYISRGNLNPDQSHNKTHLNISGPRLESPEYIYGEPGLKIKLKSSFRKEGVCGLAHVFAELTVEPGGDVKEYRILNANSELVENVCQYIFNDLKFKPLKQPFSLSYYLEFKTDIDCINKERVDLDKVDNYFVNPEPGPRQRKSN